MVRNLRRARANVVRRLAPPRPLSPPPPSSRGVACTAFLRDGDLAAADTGAPAPGEHDDEAGKSPRRHFTDRMKSAIDEGDHASALAAFDDMAQLYPDNQGVLAYELLIKLAARAGDPDAAVEALEAMLTVGYAPRVHTHGKIILACNRAGDLRRGADWLDMLLETESPDSPDVNPPGSSIRCSSARRCEPTRASSTKPGRRCARWKRFRPRVPSRRSS